MAKCFFFSAKFCIFAQEIIVSIYKSETRQRIMKKKNLPTDKSRLVWLVDAIQKEVSQHPETIYTVRKMALALGTKDVRDRLALRSIMDNLTDLGFLEEVEPQKYQIAPNKLTETKKRQKQEQDENTVFVGVIHLNYRGGFVSTDHKLLREDIFIPAAKIGQAKDGQKVVVRLMRWKRYSRYPEGEIVDVLGDQGQNDTEMHAILAEYGLPYNYPEALERDAAQIDAGITEKEVLSRKDMRDITTFTIDPEDAKDFDDALSIREVGEENKKIYEIGVHIADVTHYVRPETPLDKEAYKRATSVYLVDRTIPMLPEHLSNGICSLRPHEDKLCFSVIFQLDENANILKYDIKKTLIRSDRRFTYEEAQQRIDMGEGDFAQELMVLNRLAQLLRQRRMQKGAIAFSREEVRFRLDENGKPLSVYFKVPQEANNLIEEFMLLANRTVAAHIGGKTAAKKTFVYRVHDVPDPDKMKDFSVFIRKFGYNLKLSERRETAAKNLNKLLGDVKGKPEQDLVETLAVKSMAKAVYSTDNIGHYGLAFPYYTHFTSPIRRYPDMMVHRLLERYLKGGNSVAEQETENRCKHCSQREQLAANAERASMKYKQVEFMQDQIGKEAEGIISGVTEWGIYVQIKENKCEGMIPLRELDKADYFIYDEKNMCVEGTRSGKKYTLGDTLWIRIERANLEKRQLDFSLA